MKGNTKKLVLMAMFIALSFIGSYIPIPSPVGTLGLDSMSGYLAGLVLGGLEGGIIAFIGHILIASNKGFYLTVPVHLIVAVMMFISVYLYSFTYKKTNLFVAAVVGTLLNGVVSPLVLLLLPQFGWPFFLTVTPFLLAGSALNVILSILVYTPLKKSLFNK
ncbi:ECF transporter S component [Wukongibacter baidiensis]|uniref:ECF transporter S component n=1 Tax=Wukongibacter baidiensis TaxID=1723361 RepID=UPI003D7F476C